MSDLFRATTIPMLEQVVNFSQARHTVLAGNIANADTPGYVARDLSVADFQERLKQAVQQRRNEAQPTSPGEPAQPNRSYMANVAKDSRAILFHDQSQVGIEHQVTEMVKNRMQHNTALSIMVSQFRLLQSAISERA